MKRVIFHKDFTKQYEKLSKVDKDKFRERITIFLLDEFSPLLNNHSLKGKFNGYRSLNVKGDLRAIYKKIKEDFLFVSIDNYNNLYK